MVDLVVLACVLRGDTLKWLSTFLDCLQYFPLESPLDPPRDEQMLCLMFYPLTNVF